MFQVWSHTSCICSKDRGVFDDTSFAVFVFVVKIYSEHIHINQLLMFILVNEYSILENMQLVKLSPFPTFVSVAKILLRPASFFIELIYRPLNIEKRNYMIRSFRDLGFPLFLPIKREVHASQLLCHCVLRTWPGNYFFQFMCIDRIFFMKLVCLHECHLYFGVYLLPLESQDTINMLASIDYFVTSLFLWCIIP
jgi:hypothetical protein